MHAILPDPSDAEKFSYNSCRRWMPTTAQVLGFSRSDVQALGGWTEGVQGGARGEPPLAPMPMGAHYCDQRALASAQKKAAVFSYFLDLASQCPGGLELLMGAPFDPDMLALSWEDLAAVHATYPAHLTSPASPALHQPSYSSTMEMSRPSRTKVEQEVKVKVNWNRRGVQVREQSQDERKTKDQATEIGDNDAAERHFCI